MGPIQGLIKKDYRISRMLFGGWLGSVIVLMVVGLGFSAYTAKLVGTFPIIVIIAISQFVFGPIMMLSLLNMEGKTQLWLYSPRESHTLLLSKFGVTFTYQLMIQLVLTVYTIISFFSFGKSVYEQIGVEIFAQTIGWVNILLLVVGMSITCWIIFFWTVYQSLKSKPRIRPFRWVILIFIYIIYSVGEFLVMEVDTINEFIMRYKYDLFTSASFQHAEGDWSVFFDKTEIPIIPVVYYSILAISLFILAARLLGRKVEV